jgi:hypothetical protein
MGRFVKRKVMKNRLAENVQSSSAFGFVFSIAVSLCLSAPTLHANIITWGTNTASSAITPNVLGAKAIAAGYWHNLAIKSTNSVVAWGLNAYGQTNVPAGLKAVAVAAGRDHSLALTTNGTVVGWGINNTYSGDPDYFGQADVPPGLSNVIAIAAGGFHSAALRNDGTVVCWGYNFYGQTNVPADLTNAIAIACGNAFSLALRSDGTVEGWGDDFYEQIDIPLDLTNVIAIAAGGFHGVALKADGTVESWGDDFYGQLDSPADLTNAVAIAGGYLHSLAVRGDGTAVGWGDNTYNQVTSTTNGVATLRRVTAVAGGYGHSLALTNDSPLITGDLPTTWTTNAGSKVTFTVAAVGAITLSYKWWFSGTNTPIGTGNPLVLNSVGTNNIGSYFVTVSNTVGTVTSSVVTLILVDAGSPVITTNPAGKTVNIGSNVTFTAAALGAAPLNYQWWLTQTNFGETNVTSNPITDATNTTYTVNNAQAVDAGSYFVVVSNALGTATSANAILVVRVPPAITSDLPASITTNSGTTVRFTIGVTGTTPFTYKWRFNNTPIATNGNTLTLNNVTTNKSGTYFVVVTNSVGSVTSQVSTLTVFDSGNGTPPIIVTNPASKTVNIGSNVVFSVGATGDAPLSYQWWLAQTNSGQTNGPANPITDATNTSYTVNNAQPADAGSYFIVVTNLAGSATSSIAILTVRLPPTITNDLPANITSNAYSTVRFSVGVSGTAPFGYKWRFSGTNGVIGTANPLVLNNVTSNNIGNYFVIVSNVVGSVTSSVTTLTVVYNTALTPAQLWFMNHGLSGDALMIAMEAGKNYRVQSSADLQNWIDVTNFLSTSSLMNFTNSLSTNSSSMFYRVISP